MEFRLRMRALTALLLVMASHAAAGEITAEKRRTDTPSGYPVPRIVALKDERTNCRLGPSLQHPVRFVFSRRNAPVIVIAETYDHWRKIRDKDGDECWVHHTLLRNAKHAFVTRHTDLLTRPKASGRVRAHLSRDLLVEIKGDSRGDWVKVSTERLSGWIRVGDLWGVDVFRDASAAAD